MRPIIISVESGADVPADLAEKYNIKIVPMHVVMEQVDYFDDGSLPIPKIYDYYKRTKQVPSTSGTNAHEYVDHFTKIRAEYPDSVIYQVSYSAVTTCSFANCQLAMEQFEDIYLINSKLVCGGQAACAIKACELAAAKDDDFDDYQGLADEIAAWCDKVHCSFIPNTLDFLKAGGRVSNAAYLGATLLQLKPMIELNDEGYLVADKKYRGTAMKFVETYMKEYTERHHFDTNEPIYFLYCQGVTDELLNKMTETAHKLGFQKITHIPCGSVITCHGGPAAFGLAGVSK